MPRKKKELEETLKSVKEEVSVPEPKPLEPTLEEKAELPPPLRKFRVDQRVETGFPSAKKLPSVRGGICEFCGVLNNKVAAHLQFTLCPHYQGIGLRCTYCPVDSDVNDILAHRELNIYEYPEGSGTLVVVCDDIRCKDKHLKRFQTSR